MGFQGGQGGFGGGSGFGGRPREMHKAMCADCKQECEVPFKPSGDRPVYCKACFGKRKDSGK
ncbi:MAG: DNA-directed RNA polymerase [Candidatus Omnitrophica bacterium]|nr:DNA-directed RNA polymerase [Candidatus Omnitrophota bacterium]MBI2174409.1 DNA-directed RNA polymerase [Candidatus Omnitrophota bacterium]MBI3010686.1 DNA-directed RNA polymerase [Candidatus Omnitrophota bacterium]